MNNTNGATTGNDGISEPFQPRPTREQWTPQDLNDNRYGALIRSGLYLRDRKSNDSKFDLIAETVQTEIEERKAADDSLDERVTTLEDNQGNIDAWKQPLADEVKARKDGDENLGNRLDIETSARISADSKLTDDLRLETANRTSADSKLQGQITQEIADRTDADTKLDTRLTKVTNDLTIETQERKTDDLTISQNLQALEDELGTAAYKNTGNNAGEVVILDENGKISDSVIPSFVVNQTYVVTSEEEMLALNANVGDIAVRTDIHETFFLQKVPASELSNWIEALAPTDGVTSFNGQKGAIVYTPPVTSVNGKTGDVVIESSKQNYFTAYANSKDGKTGFSIDYPNFNLAPHTDMLMNKNNEFVWGNRGSATATILYEEVTIPDEPLIKNGIRTTQTATGQSGWRAPYYSQTPTASLPCEPNTEYTASAWVKNNASTDVNINLTLGVSANEDQTSPKFLLGGIAVPADGNWHLISYTHKTNADSKFMWTYVYTANGTTSADFTFAGYKLENGKNATSWMPKADEATLANIPKYLGTLLTSNDVQSTDPKDYKWTVNQDTTAIQKAIDDSKGFVGVLPTNQGGTGRTDGLSQGSYVGVAGVVDLNTLLPTVYSVKYYNVWGGTVARNFPSNVMEGVLEVGRRDGNVGYQMFHATGSDKIFYRRWGTTSGVTTWGGWIEIGEIANKLATARNLQVLLSTTQPQSFDGSANATGIGVKGTLPVSNGGLGNTTGSAQDLVSNEVPVNSDLNTYLNAGWYKNTYATGITNMPKGTLGTWFSLEILKVDDTNVIQRYYDIPSGKWFTRRYYDSPAVWSGWEEIGAGAGGTGSVMYGGSFGWGNTPFTGADSLRMRSTGAVTNIKGISNIVTADAENGVALFTNPTSKPITVILNPSYSAGRSTGSADTLPKKVNVSMTNADINGGIGDDAHLSDGAGSILAMANVGYTNNQSLMPTMFTIPANGKFRLSFEIDGYGALSDTYLVSANTTYIAFREDAKVQTEAISIPWKPLTGQNSGVAGEYKKIGSWTAVRWEVTTPKAGTYFLGSLPADAAPTKGVMKIVPAWSVTASDNVHIQVNEATIQDPGRVQLLNALNNTLYKGQMVFNNDSAETVSVPYLADYDIDLPNNSITVGKIVDGIGTQYAMDPSVGMYAKTREFQTFVTSSGLLINTLDSSGNTLKSYNWNPITGIKLANDVPWTDFPLNTIEWVNQGGDWTCRYKVSNNVLYIEGRIHSIQQVPVSTQNVAMGTVPGIGLDRNTTYTCRTTNGLDVHIDVSKTGAFTFQGAWSGGTKSAMGASDLLNMSFTIPLKDL